ncbi:MAG: response regulator [Bacteroidetes bacterium]|nr:response regulator [Bacteroidota bacterium]
MNILIVDDEKMTLNALQYSIESLGHVAFVAETGEEAISQVTENKIDFIISDIMMPGISGLSLVSLLRNVYLCQMPILLISTLDNAHMRNSSHNIGADSFISKPFSIADIAYKINKYAKPETNS